jgi:hypothetical protein
MILQTPAIRMVKALAEDPIVYEAIHRIFDNVRSSFFSLCLSVCLLFKRCTGTPGEEVTTHFLKAVAMQLLLTESDINEIKTGFELFQKMQKGKRFPRGSKERIALAVAFLATHPDYDDLDLFLTAFTTKQSEMRATEDGEIFLKSMKDSLYNSFIALESISGITPVSPEKESRFAPHRSDFQVIDLTTEY